MNNGYIYRFFRLAYVIIFIAFITTTVVFLVEGDWGRRVGFFELFIKKSGIPIFAFLVLYFLQYMILGEKNIRTIFIKKNLTSLRNNRGIKFFVIILLISFATAGFVFANNLDLRDATIMIGEVKSIRLYDGTIINFRVDNIQGNTAYGIDLNTRQKLTATISKDNIIEPSKHKWKIVESNEKPSREFKPLRKIELQKTKPPKEISVDEFLEQRYNQPTRETKLKKSKKSNIPKFNLNAGVIASAIVGFCAFYIMFGFGGKNEKANTDFFGNTSV